MAENVDRQAGWLSKLHFAFRYCFTVTHPNIWCLSSMYVFSYANAALLMWIYSLPSLLNQMTADEKIIPCPPICSTISMVNLAENTMNKELTEK